MKRQSPSEQARTSAILSGSKTYQGKPCKQGHDGKRYTRNNSCTECRRIDSLQTYHKNPTQNIISQKRWRRDNRERILWLAAKHRAENSGREFNLEIEDIEIPAICPVLGIPMTSPSLDRWENTKGYTKDNIRVISRRANVLKSDATVEELQAIIQYMQP